MEMKIVVDSKELEKNIAGVINAIKGGVVKGMGNLAIKTVEAYRRNIDEGMIRYTKGAGHTEDKESIGGISIARVKDFEVSVIQSSLAGKMMELPKRTPGARVGGRFVIPWNAGRGRGAKWIREHFPGHNAPITITGDSKISGLKPFKPMEQTFLKFTEPMALEVIGDAVEKEIDKHVEGVGRTPALQKSLDMQAFNAGVIDRRSL